jgi:hypothetical protein
MKSTGKSTKTTSRSASPAKRVAAPRKITTPASARTTRVVKAAGANGTAGATRSMKAAGTNGTSPGRDQIARRAYELFEQTGRQHGRDLEHWLIAEREIIRR